MPTPKRRAASDLGTSLAHTAAPLRRKKRTDSNDSRTQFKIDNDIMLSTRPCSATCVIDGRAIVIRFQPDTGTLRVAEASGMPLGELRWSASWIDVLDTFRDFDHRHANAGSDALIAHLQSSRGAVRAASFEGLRAA